LNELVVTFTDLLKFTVTVLVVATFVAPFVGVVLVTVGAVSVLKVKTKSAARCVPARSAICAATAVAVQVVATGRLALGVSVYVVTPPGGAGARPNATGVPAGHSSLKALAVTLTALVNVTVTVVFSGTLVAPLVGVVLLTVGGVSTVKVKR